MTPKMSALKPPAALEPVNAASLSAADAPPASAHASSASALDCAPGAAATSPPTATPPPPDPWAALRRHTPARIALGRSGTALPTHELLRFAAAHAQARDAVHVPLDGPALAAALAAQGWPSCPVASRAPTREAYLRRPDWGRRLDEASVARLQALAGASAATTTPPPWDLAIVAADGLSAAAVQQQVPPLLAALQACWAATPQRPAPRLAPLAIATQARVALGDEVGALLGAQAVLVLIGERPGLSSPDSLGAYLTFAPRLGRSDAERNCISNIRPAGLAVESAAQRIAWLLHEALRRRLTGVGLKDDSALDRLA